jgi:integrase/recombinase XerD
MVTIKVILRKQKTNKAGLAPLWLRVTKNRKTKFISLNIRLEPKYWDEGNQRVRGSYTNSTRINSLIKVKLAEAQAAFVDLELEHPIVRTQDILSRVASKRSPDFFEYGFKYAQDYRDKGKERTFKRFRSALNKLKEYMGEQKLFMEDIDIPFLKKYEKYLFEKHGNCNNTRHTDLKSVRRIINEAVDEQLFPFEKNPFNRYKLKWEKTNKSYLTETELKAFEEFDVVKGSMREVHHDAFVFSCYAGGLRISDICTLKWLHFNGTHITMRTKKTNSQVAIKLPQKALEIILKYKKENQKLSDRIFPILDKRDYKTKNELSDAINSKNASANKSLLRIAEKVGIEKRISFHTSRHTWATRALSKGMKIHHVSKLLGHASVRTTEVYAKIINKDLDDAMDVFDN